MCDVEVRGPDGLRHIAEGKVLLYDGGRGAGKVEKGCFQ